MNLDDFFNHAESGQGETGRASYHDPGAGVIALLGELPERTLLDISAMSKAFGVCPKTIRRMVKRYDLPPPVRVAGKSQWFAGRVLDWIEGRAESVEKEASRQVDRIKRYGT